MSLETNQKDNGGLMYMYPMWTMYGFGYLYDVNVVSSFETLVHVFPFISFVFIHFDYNGI